MAMRCVGSRAKVRNGILPVRLREPAGLARRACLVAVAALAAVAGGADGTPARTIELSMAAGETAPALSVTRSAVTTVTFLDADGAPWPIASLHVSAGAPTAQREPTHPHVATLRTDARQAGGNVVAFLEGLAEPVHLAVARDAPAGSRIRVTVARARGNAGGAATSGSHSSDPGSAADVRDVVREYLLANPDVVREAMDPSRQLASKVRGLRGEIVGQPDVPAAGDLAGAVTVVEFFDYGCGFCRNSLDAAKAAVAQADVRVEFREYPILGADSTRAARLALAADYQGRYLEAHTALMAWDGDLGDESLPEALAALVGLDAGRLREDMDSAAVAGRIEANRRLAGRLGVSGTPAFLVLGRDAVEVSPGALDAPRMRDLIAAVE